MDNSYPIRKNIRLKRYDYSSAGAYFITVCVKDKKPILWDSVGAATCRPEFEPQNVGAATCRPPQFELSDIGKLVDEAINRIPTHYEMVNVDKYCIMPDHVHMIIRILADDCGRQVAAPTISTVVGHMKRWVSMNAGCSIWQKSFIDRVIRSESGYLAVWEYIENNPIKMDFADDQIDFSEL